MKYKFIRFRNKHENDNIGKVSDWRLVCDSPTLLYEHEKQYVLSYMEDGVHESVQYISGTLTGHLKNTFSGIFAFHQDCGYKTLSDSISGFHNKIITSKLNALSCGKTLLINHRGTYNYLDKEIEVVETVTLDKLIYPHEISPTNADIRIISYPDGTHFYAKIGGMDVVDKEGNQKWNTEEEARQKAIDYIQEFHKK